MKHLTLISISALLFSSCAGDKSQSHELDEATPISLYARDNPLPKERSAGDFRAMTKVSGPNSHFSTEANLSGAKGYAYCTVGLYSLPSAKPVFSCPNHPDSHAWIVKSATDFKDDFDGASGDSSRCFKRAQEYAKFCFVKGIKLKVVATFWLTEEAPPAEGVADTRVFKNKGFAPYYVDNGQFVIPDLDKPINADGSFVNLSNTIEPAWPAWGK